MMKMKTRPQSTTMAPRKTLRTGPISLEHHRPVNMPGPSTLNIDPLDWTKITCESELSPSRSSVGQASPPCLERHLNRLPRLYFKPRTLLSTLQDRLLAYKSTTALKLHVALDFLAFGPRQGIFLSPRCRSIKMDMAD